VQGVQVLNLGGVQCTPPVPIVPTPLEAAHWPRCAVCCGQDSAVAFAAYAVHGKFHFGISMGETTPEIAPSPEYPGLHLTRGPTRVHDPNGRMSIGSAVFAGFAVVYNRQTRKQRRTTLHLQQDAASLHVVRAMRPDNQNICTAPLGPEIRTRG